MKEKIVPVKEYLIVYVALMALFALTLGLSYIDLGPFNMIIGLAIAVMKALLVVLFFMHAKYTTGIHRVFAAAGVFWLGILFTLSLSDYLSRGWLLLPGHWP